MMKRMMHPRERGKNRMALYVTRLIFLAGTAHRSDGSFDIGGTPNRMNRLLSYRPILKWEYGNILLHGPLKDNHCRTFYSLFLQEYRLRKESWESTEDF